MRAPGVTRVGPTCWKYSEVSMQSGSVPWKTQTPKNLSGHRRNSNEPQVMSQGQHSVLIAAHLLEVFGGVQAVGRGLVLGAPRDARGDVQAAREGHGQQVGVGGAPGDVAVAHLPMAQVVVQQAQRVVPPLQIEYQVMRRKS